MAFPDRSQIIFVGLACVLVTLVLQGLTLSPLVAWLQVGGDSAVAQEAAALRTKAITAALGALRADDARVTPLVRQAAIEQYEAEASLREAMARVGEAGTDTQDLTEELQRALDFAAEVERGVVLTARQAGDVSAEAADLVLDEVEIRAIRDLG